MNNSARVAVVVFLLAAVGAVVVVKVYRGEGTPEPTPVPAATAPASRTPTATAPTRVAPTTAVRPTPPPRTPAPRAALPRLVDLGAGACIPCKKMAPILEELKQEYAGRLEVVFIDVWKNPGAGEQYGIRLIPTQIFFAPDGRELFRHEGFFGKEEILAKWKELGYDLSLVLK